MDITASENDHNGKTQTYKIIGLAASSLVLQTLVWLLMYTALYGGKPLHFWFPVALVALIWVACFSLFVIINYNRWLYTGLTLAGLIAYLVIFPPDKFVWLGGLLFFVLLQMFWSRIKSLEKRQSHFSLRHLVGGSIIILTYAFLILLGFNIYYNTSQDFKRNPEQFYEKLGESAAKSFRYSEKVPSKEFDLNQSLDEFLIKHIPDEQLGNFDLSATRDEFLKRFGIKATGEETLADIFARTATDRVRESASKYEKFFPLIFTLIVIALLRGFAFVFYWLGIGVSWFLFRILLALKFFKISKVQIEVDKLEI